MTVIKTSDFFDDGYKKDLQEIANEWRKLGEDVKLVIGQLKGAGKGLRKSLEETSTSTSGGQDQIKKMAKEIQQLEKAIEQLRIAQTLYGKETVYVREQTRQKTAANKAEAQVLLSTAGSYNRLSAELKEALILIKEIDVSTTKGKEAFKKSAKEIHRMRASLKDMDAQMNNHARNVGNYQSGLKGLMGTVKRLAAVYLGFEAFRSAVRTTRDLTVQTDSLRLAYSKIIPDSAKLAKTNAFLSKTAENYGIDLNSLRKNYLRFTAASRSTNLSMNETQAIFNSVAKAGSVMGLEAIRMDRAFNALEQMLSKGKVSSEELRQQLGDSLPGSMEIMADALDVTTLELSKMLEEGKILSEDALPKFAKQLEITYGIENLTRVENLAASQGRLKTAIIELVESMETTGVFRDFYTGLADGVKFIARNIDAIRNLAKVLGSLAFAYGSFKFAAFIKGIEASTVAMTIFNAATRANPLGIMITGLSTVAGLLFAFRNELAPTNTELERTKRIYSELNEQLRENIRLNEELKPEDQESIADLTTRTNLEFKQAKIQEIRLKMREKEAQIQRLSGVMQTPGIARALAMARSELSGLSKELKEVALVDPLGEMGISTLFSQGKPTDKTTNDDTTPPADPYKKMELRINALREGYDKELALIELQEKREDKALTDAGLSRHLNDEKFQDMRLQLDKKYQDLRLEAVKKAIEEERKAEEERQKKLAKGQEFLKSVNDEYFRQLKVKQQIRIEEAKALGATKEEIDIINLTNKIELLKEELKFKKELKQVDIDLKKAQIKSAQADLLRKAFGQYNVIGRFLSDMAKASGEDDAVTKEPKDAKIFGFSLRKVIKKFLPEEVREDEQKVDKAFEAVVNGFAIAKDAMTDYYRTAIQLSNELVQQRNQEVASAERALDREIASRNAGYANFVDDAQKRLNVAKKAQEEALERRQELQRQQLIADSVIQASSLVTAAAGILKSSINPLIAIPLISLMFGTFLGAKAKALQLTRQEFSEGDLSIIGGGRHGSGNDTLVGFSGGRAQFAEQGEARMILSRRVTAKYKDVLPDLFESLNRGTFDIDALKGTNSPIPSLIVNARTDTSRMEKELVAIRRQGETQTIYDNGKKVVIKGNRIKRYV